MSVVDTLVTRFAADTRDYEAGAHRVTGATMNLKGAYDDAFAAGSRVRDMLIKTAQAVGVLELAYAGLGVKSLTAYGDLEAMQKALEAVSGSAKDAGREMKILMETAKLPGLGLQEALSSFVMMRNMGASSDEAHRLISAFGGGVARSGKGAEEFGRVMLQIAQILGKGKIQGEEITTITEAGIPAAKILQDKFGTSSGAELEKMGISAGVALAAIVAELEKLPAVEGGVKNALENTRQNVEMVFAQIGQQLSIYVVPMLDAFNASMEEMVSAGAFTIIGDAIGGLMDSVSPFDDEFDNMTQLMIVATGVVAGTADALNVLNRAMLDLAQNKFVQIMVMLAGGVGGAFGGIAMGGLTGWFDSVMNRVGEAKDMVKRNRQAKDSELWEKMSGAVNGAVPGTDFLGWLGQSAQDANDAAADANERAITHLASIDRNTREAVEIQRMILGGGNMGRFGITATDLSEIRSSPHGSPANPGFARWAGFGVPGLARR